MRIVPLTEDLVPALRAFLARLTAAGRRETFNSTPNTPWPEGPLPPPYARQNYVVLQDDVVRGAYGLRYDHFQFGERVLALANYAMPLSEGIIDRRFALVGVLMLQDAMKREPLLYGIGGGGTGGSSPRLVLRLKWQAHDIPFYFRLLRGGSAAGEIRALRQHRRIGPALRLPGGAMLASLALQAAALRLPVFTRGAETRVIDSFGPEADELWDAARHGYALLNVRAASHLRLNFPAASRSLTRLLVSRNGRTLGFAVLKVGVLQEHFGALRVGTIVDLFGHVEEADVVAKLAVEHLRTAGAGILVTNQLHPAWRQAMVRNGFLPGPSQYPFFASPATVALLAPFDGVMARAHFTRGDGDGVRGEIS